MAWLPDAASASNCRTRSVRVPRFRALLAALTDWVVLGKEPPPSRVPRLYDGTLVRPFAQSAAGFPEIPG